jgi:hypothetical protein
MAGSHFAHILAQATATEPWLEKDAAIRGRIGRARRERRPLPEPGTTCTVRSHVACEPGLAGVRSRIG